MKVEIAVLVSSLSSVFGALGDLAQFVSSNEFIAKDSSVDEMLVASVKLSMLPPPLLRHLRSSLDEGYSARFLAHFADVSSQNLELTHTCLPSLSSLKNFQACILKASGMNPHFIRLFSCLGQYEKWQAFSPVINNDKRESGEAHESNLSSWSFSKFKKQVLAVDASVKREFLACASELKQHSLASVLSDIKLQSHTEHEHGLLTVLSNYEGLLSDVPLPLDPISLVEPSDLIPLVLRHYVAYPKYQAIFDDMSFDWNLVPPSVLSSAFAKIMSIQNERPSSQSMTSGIKYLKYSKSTWDSTSAWWLPFYEAMRAVPSFSESILLAIARSQYLPEDIIPMSTDKFLTASLKDAVSTTIKLRNREVRKTLQNHGITQSSDMKIPKHFKWDVYKANLNGHIPIISKILVLQTGELPRDPQFLHLQLIKAFLEVQKYESKFDLCLLIFHPFFGTNESFMAHLVDLIIQGTPVSDINETLWSLNDESVLESSLGRDLQTVLKLPMAAPLHGRLIDVKGRIHNALVTEILNSGGDDFVILDYMDVTRFPKVLDLLIQIKECVKNNKSQAYWLAASIPNFADARYRVDTPFCALGSIIFVFDAAVARGLFQKDARIKEGLLRAALSRAFLSPSSHAALVTMDISRIKALLQLSRSDPIACLESIVSSPNFISESQWQRIAQLALSILKLQLNNVAELNTLNSYQDVLAFLHARSDLSIKSQ